MLIINNLRDYEEDMQSNKYTLIVLFGKKFGTVELISINFLAYLNLYFLLHSINKLEFIYFFIPLIIFILFLLYKIILSHGFINQKALPLYSLYIMIFTIILSSVILL